MVVTVLQLLAVIAVYEVVRHLVLRRLTGRFRQSAVVFVREHRIRMEAARFIDRLWIREAMAQDRRIDEKVVEVSRATGEPPRELRRRVDAYVEEIAPFFSLTAYYRFGARLARTAVDFLFELVTTPGAFERQAAHVPPGAVRVYVINHRANMDPLVLAYALLYHVPMSYAVGEWALVWPLHTLFRMFGSYFVRRGEKDPLYHAVLERFVQLIAGHGAVTGFFIEGGLSRDGALRRPRTGLLDYLVGLRRDDPTRKIVFLPVGLNYDRVFEDRILTREKDGPLPKPTRSERTRNLVEIVLATPVLLFANVLRVAVRAHRKFGYAAVEFGEPLDLDDWPGGSGIHALQKEQREPAMQALADELLFHRIAAVVPVVPVPILCTALLEGGAMDALAIRSRVRRLLSDLRDRGAPVRLGRAFAPIAARRLAEDAHSHVPGLEGAILDDEEAEQLYLFATGLLVRRKVLRHVHTVTGAGVEPVPGCEDLVTYYAKSIAHHLAPRPSP